MNMNLGFLKFNSLPPRVHLTGDDNDADPTLIKHLQEEGFDVTYLPRGNGGKDYRNKLSNLNRDLELGEKYAVIAFGNAATECLDAHIKPQPHLAALIAYYPPSIAKPGTKYPPDLKVLCHLAGSQGLVPAFPSYTYQGAKPGFAEHRKATFDKVAASLAWTRTLGVLRRAFQIDVDLEKIWQDHASQKWTAQDSAKIVATMVQDRPVVHHVPTMTGAVGQRDLFVFYRDFFMPYPPTLRIKLVSRTIGVDRIVDEMIISFTHTQEVRWMLPGVAPTQKHVQVAVVSVVCIRGGKLVHERMYWDQASVLVQIGLLNPNMVPGAAKKDGLKRLPVYGPEVAAKVLDEDNQPFNDLIPGWKSRPKGDPGVQPSTPRKQTANGAVSNDDK